MFDRFCVPLKNAKIIISNVSHYLDWFAICKSIVFFNRSNNSSLFGADNIFSKTSCNSFFLGLLFSFSTSDYQEDSEDDEFTKLTLEFPACFFSSGSFRKFYKIFKGTTVSLTPFFLMIFRASIKGKLSNAISLEIFMFRIFRAASV